MTTVARGRVAEEYYLNFPVGEVAAGDIYADLPTFGLLPIPRAPGIVITPACDLAQSKTPTGTYLPIVSIERWLAMADCRRRLLGGFRDLIAETKSDDLATLSDDEVLRRTSDAIEKCKTGKQKARQLQRLVGLQEYLLGVRDNNLERAHNGYHNAMAASAYRAEIEKLIKNAYSDIHFLPPPSAGLDAFAEPSLALLRFPLTVPFEILDRANESALSANAATWRGAISSLDARLASEFPNPPLRCHRLRSTFMADLATRFASLYVRVGSPDLSTEAIDSLSAHVAQSLRSSPEESD
jgi:hypothetical protein